MVWSLGTTYLPGIRSHNFTKVATPGYTLVSFDDYNMTAGAILWDFVPDEVVDETNYLFEISAVAAMVVINKYYYLMAAEGAAATGATTIRLDRYARGGLAAAASVGGLIAFGFADFGGLDGF